MAASPTTSSVNLDWIESEIFERGGSGALPRACPRHPGARRLRRARRRGQDQGGGFARQRKVPYFGICFGMQMAVIEAARSLAGIKDANSTEFGPTEQPVVGLMTEWMRGNELESARRRRSRRHDAARRLSVDARGRQPRSPRSTARPRSPSGIATATRSIWAIARCSRPRACASAASRPTDCCRRRSNIPTIPGSSACSIHPELKSRPFEPHPLFASFIGAAVVQSRLV
jgi:CTP synthase